MKGGWVVSFQEGRLPHDDFRRAHNDDRRSYDDFRMTFVTTFVTAFVTTFVTRVSVVAAVPGPFPYRDDATSSGEEGDDAA